MLNGFIWVDYAILGIVTLSVLIGIWRGFIREVLSLAAWVAAVAVAFVFSNQAAAFLESYVSVPSVRIILAFGGLFLATLFVGGLINLIINSVMRKSGLGGTDRLIGLVFGVVRGVAIVGLLVMLAGLTPVPNDPWWDQSQFMGHFEDLAIWFQSFLPPELAEYISFEEVQVEAAPEPLPAPEVPKSPA